MRRRPNRVLIGPTLEGQLQRHTLPHTPHNKRSLANPHTTTTTTRRRTVPTGTTPDTANPLTALTDESRQTATDVNQASSNNPEPGEGPVAGGQAGGAGTGRTA